VILKEWCRFPKVVEAEEGPGGHKPMKDEAKLPEISNWMYKGSNFSENGKEIEGVIVNVKDWEMLLDKVIHPGLLYSPLDMSCR
jgi:hypothetical protein